LWRVVAPKVASSRLSPMNIIRSWVSSIWSAVEG
jgi:hypothetical protein